MSPIAPHILAQVLVSTPDVYPALFNIHEQIDEVRGTPAKAIWESVDGKDVVSRMRPHMPAVAASHRVSPAANQNKTVSTVEF
jgi:hypothetical protein